MFELLHLLINILENNYKYFCNTMRLNQFLFVFFFFTSIIGFSQNENKEVLFTINDKPYYTNEFERVYKKNLDLVKDESQKDLDQYLELFIGYKLKVAKAFKEGLQNESSYKRELETYRSQLAKNYLTDTKVTHELIEEAYSRMKKEIRTSHILILVDKEASPEDTLKAYKKVEGIRKRILAGEDFETLAVENSEDPSVKENKGDLGYFSVFRMVYPYESAAYNTPKGEISKIFRTKFGYHILKVNDIRDNQGEVLVAHIMVLNPKPEDADQDSSMKKIFDIYKKLQQGEKFEDLARQFSDDKSTSAKGGILAKFSSGQLSSSEFENVAFSLESPDEISKPFKTQFGWHIIKLIEKLPIKGLDELKYELDSKISKDDRSKKITNSVIEKLKKKYKYGKNSKQLAELSKLISDDIYEGKWELPGNTENYFATVLWINSKSIPGKEFLNYVNKQQQKRITIRPLSKAINLLFDGFIDQELSGYYNENLENEFPEFSNIMEEYRDGLLLFDLMDKEIWTRSKTDTIGLQKYYNNHKTDYMWKIRAKAMIVSSVQLDVVKSAQKLLKKNKSEQEIKEKLNFGDKVNVMINTGIFEEGNNALPKNFKFEEGMSNIFKEGEYYYLVKVDEVMPSETKNMEECKGKLINDYQQNLEQNWVGNLRNEFEVKVNYDVFEKVKKEIKSK